MKILHTADWHLGVKLENLLRNEEHEKALDWLTDLIKAEEVELLVLAGDVFDVFMPSNQAQRLYYNFLRGLIGSCCQTVVIVGGNHDSPNLLEASRELLHLLNIHVIANPPSDKTAQIIEVKNKKKQLRAVVAAVPFLHESHLRKLQVGETGDERREQIRAAIAQHYSELAKEMEVYASRSVPLIATGHLFVAGGERGERQNTIHLGNIDVLPASAFPTLFDYIALGHLHKAHSVGEQKIRYSGSLIPIDFSEANYEHSVYIVEFEGRAIKEIVRHKNPIARRLRLLRGTLEQVEELIRQHPEPLFDKQPFPPTWLRVEVETKEPYIPELKQHLLTIIGKKRLEIVGEPIQRRQVDSESEEALHDSLKSIPSLADIGVDEVFAMRLKLEGQQDEAEIKRLQDDFLDLQDWWQQKVKSEK